MGIIYLILAFWWIGFVKEEFVGYRDCKTERKEVLLLLFIGMSRRRGRRGRGRGGIAAIRISMGGGEGQKSHFTLQGKLQNGCFCFSFYRPFWLS